MQSLKRKMINRGAADAAAQALRSSQSLARTGQVARSTIELPDGDVFIDEMLSSAADTAVTVEGHEGELEGSRDVTDGVVDVLPEMTEDAWEAEEIGQIAADGADWATELAGELGAELGAAKVELEQALADAQTALADAGLARSEAAQAVADASDAAAKAAQAVQDALAASELAEGASPSWAVVDPVAGDAAGKPEGAIWYVRDSAGRVLRMWELTAVGWVNRPFDETAIPQVAIGSGTYGTLAGDRLVAKSVTAAQIEALAITANELAAGAVTALKIAANAVTAEKINAGAVTTDKLSALAVTAAKIAAGAIVADKIAAGAITTGKLAATAIDGMTITGARIRTAPNGQRMEFDLTGLTSYNGAGTVTSRLYSSSGGMEMTGQLKTKYENDPRLTLLDPASLALHSNGADQAANEMTHIYPGAVEFMHGSMASQPGAYRTYLNHLGLTFQHLPLWGETQIYAGINVVSTNQEQFTEVFADRGRFKRLDLHGDSDWTDILIRPGFLPQGANERPQVQRRAGILYLRGLFSNTGMTAGQSFTVGDMPDGFAPPRNMQIPAGTSSGAATAQVFLSNTGTIQIRVGAVLSGYYGFGASGWPS